MEVLSPAAVYWSPWETFSISTEREWEKSEGRQCVCVCVCVCVWACVCVCVCERVRERERERYCVWVRGHSCAPLSPKELHPLGQPHCYGREWAAGGSRRVSSPVE